MNNADFWTSVHTIIAEGFTSEGLQKLDSYAEQFISGRLVYQRFSPQEQHGCAAGGATNVIASLLAGAEAGSDSKDSSTLSDYQRECKLGAQQEDVIERWAKAVGVKINDSKMINKFSSYLFCCIICGCVAESPIDKLYEIEHDGNTIIVQRVLGNATSANYIQIFINGEKKLNIREESIIIDHIECNDSIVTVFKRITETSRETNDTLFMYRFSLRN